MKIKKVIKVNSETDSRTSSLEIKTGEKAQTRKKIDWNSYLKDAKRVLVAVGLSFAAYSISTALFPEGMNFYWKQVAGLVIGGMALLIINYAVKTKSELSTAVAIALLMFFTFRVSYHYFIPGDKEEVKTEKNMSFVPRQEVIYFQMLQPGTHPINLADGEESRQGYEIPYGCSYNFSNPKATFILKYEDGEIAKSWEAGKWPAKSKFKIQNLSNEKFDLIIKQKIS